MVSRYDRAGTPRSRPTLVDICGDNVTTSLIAIVGLLGGAVAWGYAATLPAQYQATNSVFVTSDRGETTSELLQSSTFTQNLVQSYAQLATTPTVLGPVISKLGLNISTQALASRVTAEIPINTVFINITVTSRSSTQAVALADAISDSLATAVGNLAPKAPEPGEAGLCMHA